MVRVAGWISLHNGGNLGFAFEAVGVEMRYSAQRIGQRMAMCREDEIYAVLHAHVVQEIKRIQIVRHIAIRRINDGGAAVQDVVTRKQEPVLRE